MRRFAAFLPIWDCALQMSQSRQLIPFIEHRLAALMRVSTNPQETKAQLSRLRHYYKNAGLEFPPAAWLIEEKISAFRDNALEKRTGLVKLVEASETKEIRGFVCVRVSRFFRNTGLGKAIYTRLQRVGARLVFAEYPRVDVATIEGYKWLINELVGAETWSLDHSLRVRDGKTAKYERGETNASVAGFGAKSKRGILKWTRDAIIVRDAIRMLHDENKSIRLIAQELTSKYDRLFTRQMVLRWVKSPRYYGLVRHTATPRGKMNPATVEIKASRLRKAKWRGIVKRSWFRECQTILQSHATGGKAAHDLIQRKYLYGGRFLSCSRCGGSLYADMRLHKIKNGEKIWVAAYLCSNHRKDRCEIGAAAMAETQITEQIDAIMSCVKLPDNWKALIIEQSRKSKLANDQSVARLRGIQRQRENAALEYAVNRDISAFTTRIAEIDRSEVALNTGARQQVREEQFAAIAHELENMTAMLSRATSEERAKIIRRIFLRVNVDVVLKRITGFELMPSAAILIQSAPGYEMTETGIFVATSHGEIDERILSAVRDLGGEAMAFQIVEKSGLTPGEVRLRIDALRRAGLIEKRGHKNVAAQNSKRVFVWGLPGHLTL